MACSYSQIPICQNGCCWSPYASPRCEESFGGSISGVGWPCTLYLSNIPDMGCTPVVNCSAPSAVEQHRDNGSKELINGQRARQVNVLTEKLKKVQGEHILLNLRFQQLEINLEKQKYTNENLRLELRSKLQNYEAREKKFREIIDGLRPEKQIKENKRKEGQIQSLISECKRLSKELKELKKSKP